MAICFVPALGDNSQGNPVLEVRRRMKVGRIQVRLLTSTALEHWRFFRHVPFPNELQTSREIPIVSKLESRNTCARMNLPPPNETQTRLIWLALTGLAFALIVALVIGAVWGMGRVLN